MAWKEETRAADGVVKDTLYELGRKIAAKEYAAGRREMDEWECRNALSPSFAAGYAQAWQSLLAFASLGLISERQNGEWA